MFKVRNISNGKIILGDLNLVVKKGEELDLDLLFSRDRLDKSPSLHRCINPEQKKLVVIQKDIPAIGDAKAMADLEARLRSQITEQLTMQPLPKTDGSMDDVKKQLDFLIKHLMTQPTVQQTIVEKPQEETVEEADHTIAIQEKLLKRLSKNVETNVESKQEVKKSDINKRADELEDLL